MTEYAEGLFTIVDPPDDPATGTTAAEYVQLVRDARRAIAYPWARLIPGLRRRGLSRITVRFGLNADLPAGSIGVYRPESATIVLGYQYGPSGMPFTFAHEVGHAVDALTFSWETQQAVMALWHGYRCRYHYPDLQPMHGWAHEQPHAEQWVAGGSTSYLFRHHEAYADAFVAAFAPTIWSPRGPWGRFVHWPAEYHADGSDPTPHYDEIRHLTLGDPITVFTDVNPTSVHAPAIEWAAGEGLVTGYPDGTFHPKDNITREALCTILYREALREGNA